MKILVTGGAGYIGSHVVATLLNAGHQAVIVDDLSSSSRENLEQLQAHYDKDLAFQHLDLLHRQETIDFVAATKPDVVIHLAGYKSVSESVKSPHRYYSNNLISTLNLIEAMQVAGVFRLVFSSSAAVYSSSADMPIREDAPVGALHPYGRSKLMQEEILKDMVASDPRWGIVILRYFNPVGAHASGLIGEDRHRPADNLFPLIVKAALGHVPELQVYGDTYPTPDGTCIRDFIHIEDLAEGHLSALEFSVAQMGIETFNLGTGRGVSVLEAVAAFESVSGVRIPFTVVDPRPGDSPVSYADPTKARLKMGWTAQRTLEQACRDCWNWSTRDLPAR